MRGVGGCASRLVGGSGSVSGGAGDSVDSSDAAGARSPSASAAALSDRRVPAQIERGLKLVVQAGRCHVESPSGDIQPGFRVRQRGERSVHRWRRLLEGRGLLHRGLLRPAVAPAPGAGVGAWPPPGAPPAVAPAPEGRVRRAAGATHHHGTGAHPPGRVHRGLAVDKAGQDADIVNLGRGHGRLGWCGGCGERHRGCGRCGLGAPPVLRREHDAAPRVGLRGGCPRQVRCARRSRRGRRPRWRHVARDRVRGLRVDGGDPARGSAGRATQPDRVRSVVPADPPAAVSDPPAVVASDPPRTRSSVGQALVSAATRGPSPGRVAHADPGRPDQRSATPGGPAAGRQERQWPSCSFQQAWQL